MNLSDIRGRGAPVPQFFHAHGGNGHILGRGQVAHAWLVERGTPPHVNDDTPDWQAPHIPQNRRWWIPYQQIPHHQFRTPLCGNLRTAARRGHLRAPWYTNIARCRDCIQIIEKLGGPILPEAAQQDPWVQIPADERPTTLDPVSGL